MTRAWSGFRAERVSAELAGVADAAALGVSV